MLSSQQEIVPLIGTSMGGGFYAGRIKVNGDPFALIVAPKSEGQHTDTQWIARGKSVPGALSYFDGLANTRAMADAGSKLAQWALELRIGGHDDWYVPSVDELEIGYRNLKPTTEKNSCWSRSGINLSAVEQAYPYTPESPVQTLAEYFKAGAPQAFDDAWYWTSTQYASGSDYAWYQLFYYGLQDSYPKSYDLRARAFRRLPI